jgi:hypothetical protein
MSLRARENLLGVSAAGQANETGRVDFYPSFLAGKRSKLERQSYESNVSGKGPLDAIAQKDRPCDVGVGCGNDVHITHPGLHNIDAKILLGRVVIIIAKS